MLRQFDNSLSGTDRIVGKAVFSSAEMIISWLLYAFWLFITLIFGIKENDVSSFFLVFAFFRVPFFLFAVSSTAKYHTKKLWFTETRMLGKVGLLSKKYFDIPLDIIQNVSVKQGIVGSSAGYGTVYINTLADRYQCDFIKNPVLFKEQLVKQIELFKQYNNRSKMSAGMVYCGKCGKVNPEDNAYCKYCGSKM